MTPVPTVVLPGMDGTGLLLESFASASPERFHVAIMPLPVDCGQGYSQLVEQVAAQMPKDAFLLIAESFSGPLAIRIASAQPERVSGLVLVASFATPPARRWLARLPLSALLRLPIPRCAVRRYLLGGSRKRDLVEKVHCAIRSVPPDVLAARIQAVCKTDVRSDLEKCVCPILHVRAGADRMVPARCADQIAAANNRVRSVTIEAPHLVLATKTSEAWEHIEAFAQSLPR